MNRRQQIRFYLSILITLVGCIFFVSLQTVLESHPPLAVGILFAFGFGYIFWLVTSPKFFPQFVGQTSAESLAIIRILVCSLTFVQVVFLSNVSQTVLLPESIIQPTGVMQFFYVIPGLIDLGRNQLFLQILQWVTALILFLGIIGWQTRIVLPLGAFCFLFLGGIERQYSYLNHQGLILLDLLIVLSFTPCGDAWAIDNPQGKSGKEPIYGWSRYVCWVTVAMTYFITGMSKIRVGGFFWWESINLRTKLYQCSLAPCNNFSNFDYSLKLIHAPDFLFAIFGIVGVFGEIAFILVLFSATARIVFPLLMMSMHIGIFFLQNELFTDFIFLQLVFFDLTKVSKIIQDKFSLFNIEKTPLYPKRNNNQHSIFFYPSMVSAIIIILSIFWYYQLKFYPLTAWAVFSDRETSGKITYYKLNADYKSGDFGSAHPEKLPYDALYNSYKAARRDCFDKIKNGSICQDFFQIFPTLHNKYINPKDEIKTLKLEQWQWNFKKYPDDKNYGKLINHQIYNYE